jgi:hypothetical protein
MKPTGTIIAFAGALWTGVPDALDWIGILSEAHTSMKSFLDTISFPESVPTAAVAFPEDYR